MHPHTLATRGNLAVAYHSVGRDAEAAALEAAGPSGPQVFELRQKLTACEEMTDESSCR
jgi:hypothetical protein